jgi:hypothetical protein
MLPVPHGFPSNPLRISSILRSSRRHSTLRGLTLMRQSAGRNGRQAAHVLLDVVDGRQGLVGGGCRRRIIGIVLIGRGQSLPASCNREL